MFAPIEKGGQIDAGKPGFGLLNEDGTFELSTYGRNDGAVVGKHWVTLMSLPDRRTEADRAIPSFRRLPVVTAPVEVLAGQDNDFDFDVSIDTIREYAE